MVEFSVHNSLGQSVIQQKEKSNCPTVGKVEWTLFCVVWDK